MKTNADNSAAEVFEKAVQALADLIAELGACPPSSADCPQRNKLVNIKVCSKCLQAWALARARGESC